MSKEGKYITPIHTVQHAVIDILDTLRENPQLVSQHEVLQQLEELCNGIVDRLTDEVAEEH